MDRTEHRFSPSGRLPGGDFRVRRQFCQQDGAEQQRERAAPPGHVCASAHGGVSGAQSRFAGADCPADRRAHCPADRRAPCPADCRMESVHVSPPSFAAVYAPGRFFMRAGGLPCGGRAFCIPGLNPGGTYSPNKKGTRRGACLVCRLPTMPLVYFLSPIPPTPFPSGEGGDQGFFMQGASPLASPGLNPGGTDSTCWGFLSGRFYKCRKRFNAGVPGAKPPAK